MIEWFAGIWRGGRQADRDRALAREAALLRTVRETLPATFVADQLQLARRPNVDRLGSLADSGDDFLVAVDALLAHMLVLGSNGSGKTFLLLALALRMWRAGFPMVVVDPKGEMAELLLDRLIPAVLARLAPPEQARLLAGIRVVDPFDVNMLPPMNPLVRDASIPVELQALDVASCMEAALDAGSGVRMETIADWLLRLLIGRGTFLAVRRALQEPSLLEALVRASTDRDVISYFLNRWPTEPMSSKLALASRLDRLLALPATRLSLSASSNLDFDGMLRGGLTVVNLGRAPAGLTELTGFWSTLVFTNLVRAIQRRPATGAGVQPAIVLVDEWQSCVTRPLVGSIEDVLARARSRSVFLWLCNQQRAQIEKVAGSLWEIATGQTSMHVMFRATIEDARAMRHLLPTTGRMVRPARTPWDRARERDPFLSPSDELEARVQEVSQLPNRTAYWWDRRQPWPAVRFRTATLDVASARMIPAGLRDAVKRGAVAVPVAELERVRDAEQSRLDQLARQGATPAQTPAPLGSPPKRRKRKGTP